jgi:hypothetical protein
MFETQEPLEKRSKSTMLAVILAVFVILGLTTWYFTQ